MVAELAAREAIRDAISRLAQAGDTGRIDDLLEHYAEDGALEVEGRVSLGGRAAIRQFLTGVRDERRAAATRPLLRHHVSSLFIDLDGTDVAQSRAYFLAITERGPDHWGRYRDDWARLDGRWLLRRRLVKVDGWAEGSSAADR